jgi:putative membrane protein
LRRAHWGQKKEDRGPENCRQSTAQPAHKTKVYYFSSAGLGDGYAHTRKLERDHLLNIAHFHSLRLYCEAWRTDVRHLINWILSALAVWVVSRLIPGFHVTGVAAALIAALVIGFVNATLGLILKVITLPLTILTLGIFWFVINALMLEMAAAVVPGFHIDTFLAAFEGAVVLSLVNMLFRWLAGTGKKSDYRANS